TSRGYIAARPSPRSTETSRGTEPRVLVAFPPKSDIAWVLLWCTSSTWASRTRRRRTRLELRPPHSRRLHAAPPKGVWRASGSASVRAVIPLAARRRREDLPRHSRRCRRPACRVLRRLVPLVDGDG